MIRRKDQVRITEMDNERPLVIYTREIDSNPSMYQALERLLIEIANLRQKMTSIDSRLTSIEQEAQAGMELSSPQNGLEMNLELSRKDIGILLTTESCTVSCAGLEGKPITLRVTLKKSS